MAITLSEWEEQRDALELAIARRERSVQYGDRRVDYRSVADMQQALAFVERKIAALSGKRQQRKVLPIMGRGQT